MRSYFPALDRLRFAAFLSVFVHHVFPQEPERYLQMGFSSPLAHLLSGTILSGSLGVDLFFVLSSYLITGLLLEEVRSQGSFALGNFWARRALRIWPLYFLYLAFVVWIVPKYLVANENLEGYLLPYALFYGNWACVLWNYPHSTAVHLWSVSIEEQFYLLWPLLLKVFGGRRIPQLGFLLLLIGFATRLFLVLSHARHPAFWCNTLAHIDPIVVGALLSYSEEKVIPLWNAARRRLLLILAFLLPISFCIFFQMETLSGWPVFFFLPTAALCCGLILLAVIARRVEAGRSNLFLRLLSYLGKISYGLYVWHFLVVRFLRLHLGPAQTGFSELSSLFLQFFSGLGITVTMAALSYELFEWPFLRLKDRFRSRDSHLPPAGVN